MSRTSVKFKIGDAIVLEDEKQCGVVVQDSAGDKISAQLLEQDAKTKIWHIGSAVHNFKFEQVSEHISLHGIDDNAPRAWAQLGFRMLDGSSFVHKDDEQNDCSRLFPIGDPAFEVRSESEDDSDDEMADFIVPDDQCEPFTFAEESNDFVRQMHDGVRWFENWKPRDERECALKRGIRNLEAHAARVDDESRFRNGLIGARYNCPDVQ